ncbi:hypothetical protein Tco_0341211 [Tanacetum coccineum]
MAKTRFEWRIEHETDLLDLLDKVCGRVTKENRSAGLLDNFVEGESTLIALHDPKKSEVALDLCVHYDHELTTDYLGFFKGLSHVNYNVRMVAADVLAVGSDGYPDTLQGSFVPFMIMVPATAGCLVVSSWVTPYTPCEVVGVIKVDGSGNAESMPNKTGMPKGVNATFRPFRQRHVAGEIYPQRNVAGEKLMGFADAFARYDSGGASGSGGSCARDGDDTGGEDGGDDTS